MPLLLALALVVAALVLVFAVMVPLSLLMRYRVATSRRRLRGWVVSFNVVSFAFSASLLLGTAMVMGFWLPQALPYVAAGLGIGALLGLVNGAVSRWEEEPEGVYVTANRPLIVLVTLVVVGRIAYGFWRAWTLWPGDGAEGATGSWLAAAGVAGSMAAGAILVGHSLAFWSGLRVRLRRSVRRRSG